MDTINSKNERLKFYQKTAVNSHVTRVFPYIILFDSHHNHLRLVFSFIIEFTTVVNSPLNSPKLESLMPATLNWPACWGPNHSFRLTKLHRVLAFLDAICNDYRFSKRSGNNSHSHQYFSVKFRNSFL